MKTQIRAVQLKLDLTGLLTIVFITLKLIGKIDWSWWWVLSPIWIPTGIVLVICLIVLIVLLIKELLLR